MGADNSDASGGETQVVLNVYDLTPMNNYTYWFGFGIFHTGIEVQGKEYGFGAHEFPLSGVFEVEPKRCPGFLFRCSISLGCIDMDPSEFRVFIQTMASEYHGDTYHLISKNCNHFTDDICWRLVSRRIPGWINRLAHLGSLCSCFLPESLQVTAVKQLPNCHDSSSDEEDRRIDCLSDIVLEDLGEMEDATSDQQLLPLPSLSGGGVEFIEEFEHKK